MNEQPNTEPAVAPAAGRPTGATQGSIIGPIVETVDKIRKLIDEGYEVYLGDVKVEQLEILPTKRGFIIRVNGVLLFYPSDFAKRKIRVIKKQGVSP